MKKIEDVKADLTRLRDEAKVQVELGRMEIRDEWNELETKWNRFLAEARVHESGQAIKSALASLADELRQAYERMKNAA